MSKANNVVRPRDSFQYREVPDVYKQDIKAHGLIFKYVWSDDPTIKSHYWDASPLSSVIFWTNNPEYPFKTEGAMYCKTFEVAAENAIIEQIRYIEQIRLELAEYDKALGEEEYYE